MCGNVEARGGELPFSQAVHGDREARAFDRYYLFRAYRLRQVQQRLMGRIGYGSIEKYLTSSEMPDIVERELVRLPKPLAEAPGTEKVRPAPFILP